MNDNRLPLTNLIAFSDYFVRKLEENPAIHILYEETQEFLKLYQ